MSALRTVIAAGLLAAIATPAWGEEPEDKWETRIVPDKPVPVVLDPAKAYVLVRSNAFFVPLFLHQPNADEAAAHARRRAEALAKEHAKWEKKFASWQAEMKSLERTPASVRRPARPVEPTEANFGFPEYERLHTFTVGPQNRFSKTDGSVWLQEVPPGEYVFYGSMALCACLGTVSFDAPAGNVVALEIGLPFIDALRDSPKEERPKSAFDLPPGTSSLRIGPAQVSDSRLPADKVIPADFKPAGTRPNWFGQEVDRVMPIGGLFDYERGKQIDLRPKPAG